MALPQDMNVTAGELMLAIKDRLDEIIGGAELLPQWDCQECQYCLFQALCGRENYYKALRENN